LHNQGIKDFHLLIRPSGFTTVGSQVDMTPPNKLEETLSQVVKILRSRGCRRVPIGFIHAVLTYTISASRKNPVFVKSVEAAIEVSQVYAKERSEHLLSFASWPYAPWQNLPNISSL